MNYPNSFEIVDRGSILSTPGMEWRPSEHFVRVHHRSGDYVIYRAYGYTGWNGRGCPRKYFPVEYTLARLDRLPENRWQATPLKTVTPGKKRNPLEALVAKCDRLGSGLKTLVRKVELAEGPLRFDDEGKAWVQGEEIDSFLAEQFRPGELVRVVDGLFDKPGGQRSREYYLESVDRCPSRLDLEVGG